MIDTDLYEAKRLYPFQEETVKQVLDEFRTNEHPFNLLYQLPTGGGKLQISNRWRLERRSIPCIEMLGGWEARTQEPHGGPRPPIPRIT